MHCIIQIVSLEKVRQKILRKAFPGKVFLNLVQIIRIPNRGHWWNFSWFLQIWIYLQVTKNLDLNSNSMRITWRCFGQVQKDFHKFNFEQL